MSVTAQGLKDEIVAQINALTDEDKQTQLPCMNAVADSISYYLSSSLEVNGVYTGVLAGTPPPPDPLSGPYTWAVSTMLLTGAQLVTGATSSFASWVTALEAGLKTITFTGADNVNGYITAAPGTLSACSLISLTQAALGESDSFDDTWEVISTAIIDDLLITPVLPTPAAATSSSPGTGTVVWGLLK